MPEGNSSPETSPSAGGPNLHEAPAIPGQSGIEDPQSLPHQTLPHVGDRPLHPGGLEAALRPPIIGERASGEPIYKVAGGADNKPPEDNNTNDPYMDWKKDWEGDPEEVAEWMKLDPNNLPQEHADEREFIERFQKEERMQQEIAAKGRAGGEPSNEPQTTESAPGPEGSRGSESSENIWSPEFRERGVSIFMEIFALEAEPYKQRYDSVRHPPNDSRYRTRLDELYEQWKIWVGQKGEQSHKDKPFKPSPEPIQQEPKPAEEVTQVVQAEETVEPLADLRPARELLAEYRRLRIEEPDKEAEIIKIEEDLSRYFNEAKRTTRLLDTVDASLGPIYQRIMEGIQREKSPDEIWKEVDERIEVIAKLGKKAFQALRSANRGRRAKELEKLDEVWEVYADLAIDRFSLLTEGEELDETTINGEFKFDISRMDFSTRTGEEGLRRFLPTDAELRALSERSFSDKDLAGMTSEERERIEREQAEIIQILERFSGGSEEEFQRLNLNRQEVYQRLFGEREATYRQNVREREEARANLAGDREALRRLREERGDEELYWSPTYANYFTVIARSEEQFQIAVDTFIQWLRSGLTKSPNEIFQRVSGFKDALTTAGQRERVRVRNEFMIGLRQELEGLVGVSGADWANEHYNAANYKQFMDFLAQDEGPARFIRLGKAHGGKVAKILWQFDNDPRLELLFSSHGSRGQLMNERSPVEQEMLQAEIMNILILETMGSSIKNYHPDDQMMKDDRLEENLDKLSKFRLDKDFKNLFEGFDQESQDKLFRELTAKQSDTLKSTEVETLRRLTIVRKMQQDYRKGNFDPESLKGEEKRLYEDARNAVTLAYEMYGVMGEKARRGGGVFQVERRDEQGKKFFDYVPISWTEKFVQFAENWVRATYGGELDAEAVAKLTDEKGKTTRGISAAELKYRVDQARRMAIWAIKTHGFNAQLFDFTLLKNGVPIDPNTLGYSKYGQDVTKDIDKLDERVSRFRYAPPEDTRLLGYTSTGKPVTVSFDADGKLKTRLLDPDGKPFDLEFDEQGNVIVYNKSNNSKNDRQRILFDNFKKDTTAQLMLLKTPKENPDGTLDKDENGKTIVEKFKVDFETATHHYYSRWTGHPYWGYQEEDTELLLKSIEDARLVKEGRVRPQDVGPHAIQLLIVDPTLQRVAQFRHRENREDRITLAAVEEKYQAHYRITDELHEAFYPADADDEYNRIIYNLQDHGGSTKMWENHRALNARWTDMMARRGRTLIPTLPLHFASMSEVWGAPSGGALDVLRMMAYGQYRMVGQFALEKWIGQTEAAQDLFEALYGYASPQEKRDREGYVEKPTDNADVILQPYGPNLVKLLDTETLAEGEDIKLMDDVRKSRGRKETVIFRIRVLETTKRGERAPLWLEGVDIFIRDTDGAIMTDEDGEWVYNRVIDRNRDSGSSRHSATIFFWRDVRWLRSDKPGEGQDLYKDTARYYELMDLPQVAARRLVREGRLKQEMLLNNTRWHQELAKEVR